MVFPVVSWNLYVSCFVPSISEERLVSTKRYPSEANSSCAFFIACLYAFVELTSRLVLHPTRHTEPIITIKYITLHFIMIFTLICVGRNSIVNSCVKPVNMHIKMMRLVSHFLFYDVQLVYKSCVHWHMFWLILLFMFFVVYVCVFVVQLVLVEVK